MPGEHYAENEDFIIIAENDRMIGKELDFLSHIKYKIVRPNDFAEKIKHPLMFFFMTMTKTLIKHNKPD